jgi:hypothetical protein
VEYTDVQYQILIVRLLAALLMSMLTANSALAAGVNATSTWKAQTQKFNYTGFTTYYTCDGLEDKVRQVLLHLGARSDVKVRATGCAYGWNEPSPHAWVEAAFYALAPTADAAAGEVVATHWSTFELAARRPTFMGDGECELIQQMRRVIETSFALREVDYRASCAAHQISLGDFSVHGQVLLADKH